MPKVRRSSKSKSLTRYSKFTSSARRNKKSSLASLFRFMLKISRPILILGILFVAIFYPCRFLVSKIYASEMLILNNIEIVGCKNITAIEIQKLIPFIRVGDNLLNINLSRAKEEIQKDKQELKNVSVSRNWKDKSIVIEFTERIPEVFIYEDKKILGLDFDNIPFRLIGDMVNVKVPTLSCNTTLERTEILNFIKNYKEYLTDFIPKIKEIKVGELNDIIFVMDNKTTIYFGNIRKTNLTKKILNMKKIFSDSIEKYENVEYIDLSYLDLIDNIENRVLVKPQIKTQSQQQ